MIEKRRRGSIHRRKTIPSQYSVYLEVYINLTQWFRALLSLFCRLDALLYPFGWLSFSNANAAQISFLHHGSTQILFPSSSKLKPNTMSISMHSPRHPHSQVNQAFGIVDNDPSPCLVIPQMADGTTQHRHSYPRMSRRTISHLASLHHCHFTG